MGSGSAFTWDESKVRFLGQGRVLDRVLGEGFRKGLKACEPSEAE